MRSFSGLFLLLACIALVALAITNPQMDDFEAFAADRLEEQLQGEMQEQTGGSRLGRLLGRSGAGLVGSHLDRISTRKNYLVASVYTVDLDGEGASELEWRFLGIGDRFFPLETPEQNDRQP